MNLSVASVTVAYNEGHVLPRQVQALLCQTRPLDEIIVVDNASIDGTRELLVERYPQVTVLKMPENLGAGAAWAKGLAYAALEKRHDWIVIFDADSIPGGETLAALLRGIQSLPNGDGEVGMVAPLPIDRETGAPYSPLFWRDGFVKPPAHLLREPIWYADLVITSGLMVRREVVEKIGLPRADFFMDFIDFEYCLRARSYGYKIAIVTGAKLAHDIGKPRLIRLPGLAPRLHNECAPWREYYGARNITYAAWWLYPSRRAKRFVLRRLAWHAGGVVALDSNKLHRLKRMVQGFWDGRRANLGKRFRP